MSKNSVSENSSFQEEFLNIISRPSPHGFCVPDCSSWPGINYSEWPPFNEDTEQQFDQFDVKAPSETPLNALPSFYQRLTLESWFLEQTPLYLKNDLPTKATKQDEQQDKLKN